LKKNIFIKILAFWILTGCNSKMPYLPPQYERLSNPIGIKVFANPGKTFTLYYFVQNKESTFDGYNIYVSREAIGSRFDIASKKSLYPPYTLNGSYPSIPDDSGNFNVDTPKKFIISNFIQPGVVNSASNNLPFEQGTRYFFKITAHSFNGQESLSSNEISSVALP